MFSYMPAVSVSSHWMRCFMYSSPGAESGMAIAAARAMRPGLPLWSPAPRSGTAACGVTTCAATTGGPTTWPATTTSGATCAMMCFVGCLLGCLAWSATGAQRVQRPTRAGAGSIEGPARV